MQIHQLRAFVATVEEGGVGAAARSLRIAQPTLTRALRQLEATLGGPLLLRGPAGTVPTPMGCQLLSHARRILRSHERTLQAGRQLAGSSTGDIRIAASAIAHSVVLPAVLDATWKRFPEVRIDLVEPPAAGLSKAFDEDAVDLAVCEETQELSSSSLVRLPLMNIPLAIAMRRGHHLLASGDVGALRGAVWITADRQEAPDLARVLSMKGVAPSHSSIHFASIESSLGTVAATDMLALAPEPLVRRAFEDGQLAEPRFVGHFGNLSLCAYQKADAVSTPAAAYLMEVLTLRARAQQGSG